MRGLKKTVFAITGLAIAAAGVSAPSIAESGDSFKDWQAYQYLKVDAHNAVIWTSKHVAYQVSFDEACDAMFTEAANRTRVKAASLNRVKGESRDRMVFGFTSCYINGVNRVNPTQIASLLDGTALAAADIEVIDQGR